MKGFAGIALDSAKFALSGLRVEKFRTVLSLSGVSIGIFSIVSVFTLVDSLQKSLNDGLREFGTDVAFIDKLPLEPDLNENGIFKWWEYVARPQVSYGEYLFLKENNTTFGGITWSCFLDGQNAVGVSPEWEMAVRNNVASGRKFTLPELLHGAPVAIAGADYAEANKLDSVVILDGIRCSIIGTLEKSGINSVSLADIDRSVLIPAKLAMRLSGFAGCRTSIALRPAPSAGQEACTREAASLMRRCRRLTPQAKDNFSVNRLSFIINEMQSLFRMLDSIGWIIGIFSLLVGGFGIANIMFVSVKERTARIGLQKALGATRRVIRTEYLTEAVTLSLSGGIVGLAAVWGVTLLLKGGPLPVTLSVGNALFGLSVAAIIGIAAGVAPATAAAKLDPAEALQEELS